MATKTGPTLADIEAARARIGDRARLTAVYGSEALTFRTGREVLLKAENLQRTGSFKIRGAVNILASLTEAERAAGVIAASAGNHGQAVASAAREGGGHATIENGSGAGRGRGGDRVGQRARRQTLSEDSR